jgi:hypothetical protein
MNITVLVLTARTSLPKSEVKLHHSTRFCFHYELLAVSLHYVIQIKANRNKVINVIILARVKYFLFCSCRNKKFHCLLVMI